MTDESIFAAALAIPSPTERAAYLDRACGGDARMRGEVEALLSAHAADNPLDRPPANLALTGAYQPATLVADPPPAAVGDRVGPYRLMELLGEGGFGLVFVAEQTEPVRRKVALKVLKPGMDTRDVVARFEAERQALALMDHPNIAKVLDAGQTPQGRPYFVMELVRGVPITDYCDQHKLAPRERLALFVQVCNAVQHAHQKGVIHRDLKPSNVLVTSHDGVPVPKVIDFGVAKAVGQSLTEKTIYTRFAQMIGTPLYMSPEQAEMSGLDVDTRSDVYSLGVMLYELLTGTTPFDKDRFRKAAFDEIRRIIREEEPPRPSTRLTSLGNTLTAVSASRGTEPGKLAGLIRGELDWIVMRSLEKDRNRRYESASGLAKDVQRYLSGDAVEACPPTLGYLLRKAYRRNRPAVLVAAAFAAVLLIAFVVNVWHARRATLAEVGEKLQRIQAEANFEWAMAETNKAITSEVETARQRDETQKALGKLRLAQGEQQASQYVWDMQLLPLAFEAGNVAEVNRLLDRHVPAPGQPDRRGFEWFYWDRQLHTDLWTDRLPDAARRPGSWAASPDGSRVAVLTIPGWGDGPWAGPKEESAILTVWDVASRKVVLTHRMPPPGKDSQTFSKSVFPPLFSHDGRRVLICWTGSAIGVLADGGAPVPRHRQVLDVATGKVLLQLDGGGMIPRTRLRLSPQGAFSPDGRRFAAIALDPASGNRARARVWELETGREVCASLDADDLAESPFSPDGARLVTVRFPRQGKAIETRVSVWDLAGGQEAAGWDVPELALSALAASPDGKLVAGVTGERPAGAKGESTRSEPRAVKVWETTTGKELHAMPMVRLAGTGGQLARAFFSPDGSRLAVERQQADWRTGAQALDLTLWDPVGGKPLPSPTVPAGDSPRGLRGPVFSPDGKQIVSIDGNVLRTWDVETGRPILALRGHVAPLEARAFTSDSKRVWSLDADGLLKEWDVRPPGRVAIPLAGGPEAGVATIPAFAVSLDGGRVAALIDVKKEPQSLQTTREVKVWDASGKSIQVLVPPPRDPVPKARERLIWHDIALSRDGRRAALTRYDTPRGGKDPAAGGFADLTVWDADTGAVLLHQSLGAGHIPHAALSPDGRTAAVATRPTAEGDAQVRVFDVDARRERLSLPLSGVRGVAGMNFSPDGRRLAVVALGGDPSNWGKLTVWDALSGSPLYTIEAISGGRASGEASARIAWSPDGSRFAFARDPMRGPAVEVYDAATGKPLLTLDQPAEDSASVQVGALAYSPDGRRVAALLPARTLWGPRMVKVWDAASGKELLTLRPAPHGSSSTNKRLTFGGDGHRLIFTEIMTEFDPPGVRFDTRSLVLTTWDATPVADREPKKP